MLVSYESTKSFKLHTSELNDVLYLDALMKAQLTSRVQTHVVERYRAHIETMNLVECDTALPVAC